MTKYPLTAADHALIELAKEALDRAYDEHYHVVGGALRCRDEQVYTGVNCDGIHGSCAEFVAVGAAVSAGIRGNAFDTIVAVHRDAPNFLVPPCGNCRQMLFEYCPDILVILHDETGTPVKVPARELLPLAYVEPE
jgi:cytidine deaminase